MLRANQRRVSLGSLMSTKEVDPRLLVEHASTLEDEELRLEVIQAGAAALMLREGVEAGESVVNSIQDAVERMEARREAVGAAAELRPRETVDWLMAQEGEAALALGEAVRVWVLRDFRSAAEWLGAQEPSQKRDQAIETFAVTINSTEPEAAITWAREISDPAERERVVRQQIEIWEGNDPESAKAWKEKQ